MGHSFLGQIAQKIVESYVARTVPRPPVITQPLPIEPPLEPIEPPLEERISVMLPVTPPNERVTEIDFKQAVELEGIANSMSEPETPRVEAVDAIYNRLLTAFPLFPELSPRSISNHDEQVEQELQSVPITPPSAPAPASISPAQSDTFEVVDASGFNSPIL